MRWAEWDGEAVLRAMTVTMGSPALPTQLSKENREILTFADGRRRKLTAQDSAEIGMPGTKIFAGMIFEDPNTELQGFRRIPKLLQMSYDATVAAMLAVHDRPIRAAPWRVEPSDDSPEALDKADFVWWCLNEFGTQSFDDVIREAHTRFWSGFNACLHPATPVLTATGRPRPISEIKPGDRVLSGQGASRQVVHVWKRPFAGDMVSVRLRGYPDPIRLTGNHRLPTLRGWMHVDDLVVGDGLLRPRPTLRPGGDHEAGWLVGTYIAEGHRRKEVAGASTLTWNVALDEAGEVASRIDAWLGQREPVAVGGRRHAALAETAVRSYPQHGQGGAARVVRSDPRLRELIDEWVEGDSSSTKALTRLPDEQEFARGVWEGWHWGDGCAASRRATTVSRDLAHQMQILGGSLGLPAPMTTHAPRSSLIKLQGQIQHIQGRHRVYVVGSSDPHRMAWKWTPELWATAQQLRGEGLSYAAIGRRLGLAGMSVWHWFHKDGPRTHGLQLPVTDDAVVHEVLEVTREPYTGLVYDLEVEEHHTYCAAPITVHNSEICYNIVDAGKYKGYVAWDKLAWRHPASRWRWDVSEVDTAGGAKLRQLIALTQLAPPEYRFIPIPRDKLLLWVQDLTGENFDGDPLIRKSYAAWFFKTYLMKIQAIGLQRGYMGIPIATYPENFTENEVAAAQSIVETMRTSENAGVVKPAHLGLEVVHLALEGTPMQQAIDFHDRQILMSTLSQFLQLGPQGGAFALSQDQSELFLMQLDAQANYDAQVFNLDPGIPRLIQYNYGPQELYPRLVHGQIGQRDFERLARGLAYMAMAGLLTPDDGLEDALRDQLSLPERDTAVTDDVLKNLITGVVGEFYRFRSAAAQESARYSHGQPLNQAAMIAATQQAMMNGQPPPQPPNMITPTGPDETSRHESGSTRLGEDVYGLSLPPLGSASSQRFGEAMARRRWQRPKGRLTDEHRKRIRATEQFSEALEVYRPHIGEKMVKPSVYAAMHRQPYVLRSDVRLSEGTAVRVHREGPVITQAEAIAVRASPKLQALLDKFGPPKP